MKKTSSTQFIRDDWNCSALELISEMLEYMRENVVFSASQFLQLKFHLVKGQITERHEAHVELLALTERGITIMQGALPLDFSGELTLDDIAALYDKTIIKDRTTKCALFLLTLNNYTDEGQMNAAFESVSSSGKTYVALEVLSLFPVEDIEKLLYASPKSFFHQFGELVEEDGETPLLLKDEYLAAGLIRWQEDNIQPEKGADGSAQWRDSRKGEKARLKAEWEKIPKGIRVDLHQKIIIFLDQPHYRLLQALRPLLSHDEKVTIAQFAEKDGSGSLYSKRVFIVGYPTVIHLSAMYKADEQEKTRLLIFSPEVDDKKLRASIELLGEKHADREAFEKRLDENPARSNLKARIRMIKAADISEVKVKKRDMAKIVKRFQDDHAILRPRHQRDFPRLLSFINGHALLNFMNRKKRGRAIYAEQIDIDDGYGLYAELSIPNEMGLAPALWEFWENSLKPRLSGVQELVEIEGQEVPVMGIKKQDLRASWFLHFGSRLNKHRLSDIIDILQEVDLIDYEKDPNDKRIMRIYPRGASSKKQPPKQPPTQQQVFGSKMSSSDIEEAKGMRPPISDSQRATNIMNLRDAIDLEGSDD